MYIETSSFSAQVIKVLRFINENVEILCIDLIKNR